MFKKEKYVLNYLVSIIHHANLKANPNQIAYALL